MQSKKGEKNMPEETATVKEPEQKTNWMPALIGFGLLFVLIAAYAVLVPPAQHEQPSCDTNTMQDIYALKERIRVLEAKAQ